jgi:GNAT superfamily N-acetyltransferase
MTEPLVPQLRSAVSEDLDEVAKVLADAFADYPWTRWTVDSRNHAERIEGLQRLVLERVGLPFGRVWVACVGARIEAASIWTDSRTPPPEHAWSGMADEQRALEGDRHEAACAAEAAAAHLRPTSPHLYLGAVGTRARSQRLGLGTAVLAPTLAEADDDGVAAFLETSSEDNLRFYGRLGFEVVGHVQLAGGPPVWAMLRPPADP